MHLHLSRCFDRCNYCKNPTNPCRKNEGIQRKKPPNNAISDIRGLLCIFLYEYLWRRWDSNPRLLACHASTLTS